MTPHPRSRKVSSIRLRSTMQEIGYKRESVRALERIL
jgi:hypothetical protein